MPDAPPVGVPSSPIGVLTSEHESAMGHINLAASAYILDQIKKKRATKRNEGKEFATALVGVSQTQTVEGEKDIFVEVEGEGEEGKKLMDVFRKSKGFVAKGSAIESFIANEPGRVVDAEVEAKKSKIDREDEEKRRQEWLASVQDWLVGMSSDRDTAWKQWRTGAFVEGFQFKLFFIILVCINGMLIGVEADHGNGSAAWQALEIFFLLGFTVELMIKSWCAPCV